MKDLNIKVKIYKPNWNKKTLHINNMSEAQNINFSEDINAGQWPLSLKLSVPFTNNDFSIWDILEYSIYNEKYKSWLLKYSWIIKYIKRWFKWAEQYIILELESLTWILKNTEINKTYSWTIQNIITNMINDISINSNYNMDFLGNNIFKNNITSSVNTSVLVSSNLLSWMQELFEKNNIEFYISRTWEIKDIWTKYILKYQTDIVEWDISEDTTNLVLWSQFYELEPLDKIKILNIPENLNQDNEVIQRVNFSLYETSIELWKIYSFN